MEIKVNVINEMQKLRTVTYADRYTWVDEVIQNCQRAKATHVDVTIEDDKIVISDNGIGCTDPEVLFVKSSSGWDESTTKNESPFGEGFFSTMMIANTITVTSVGFTAVFDVNKMFSENTVDAVDVYPNRKRTGFTLTLTDLCETDDTWYRRYQIENRFKEVAKYIKSPTVSINGEKVRYEGLTPLTNDPFIRKVSTPYFKGWLQPNPFRYYKSSIIKCFAFSRLVKDSTKFRDIGGVLNFADGAITLRSPDRKEFVQDEKYETAMDALREEIRKMYLKVLREGDDELIKTCSENIDEYVGVDNYKKYIKFKFLTKSSNIHGINDADDENDTAIESSGAELAVDNTDIDTDIADSPITDIDTASVTSKDDFGTVSYLTTNNIAAKTKTKRTVSAQTGDDIDTATYGFYVLTNDKYKYTEQIEIAQYYSIPVIEIRNSLEKTIIENDDRFEPIENMKSRVTISTEYRNMYPCTIQEIRASKLLTRVAQAVNADENLFVIGDTKCQKILNMNGQIHVIENLDAIATACDGKIYIDRKYMTAYKDLTDDSPTLTPADIKFLLLNVEVFAHEMSHALYNNQDNTKEHAEAIIGLMNTIIGLIYGRTDSKVISKYKTAV
jgi:hypothetical protein